MPMILKLVSELDGEFDFVAHPFDPPLISRRISNQRLGRDQGPSMRRIEVSLQGFFKGNKNDEVMAKLETLLVMLRSNQLTLIYNDSERDIVNQRVWVDDYSDPSEWKQYIGNYAINLHYFEPAYQKQGELFTVSYIPSVYNQPDPDTYTFDPPPSIAQIQKVNRQNPRAKRRTPSEKEIDSSVMITLEGFLSAGSSAELTTKADLLRAAFLNDGTLNYGPFTKAVRVGDINIPNVFPMTYLDYSIQLFYDMGLGITEFSATREFSRVHHNPKIRERPYCGPPTVKLLCKSGQTITYNIKIVGYNITDIRKAMMTEAALITFAGGVEMPGGREVWDEQEVSVNLTYTKFHTQPILNNLFGTDHDYSDCDPEVNQPLGYDDPYEGDGQP